MSHYEMHYEVPPHRTHREREREKTYKSPWGDERTTS